jgi:prepilin-type N-terminal cleavage/methylation domain-containing protein
MRVRARLREQDGYTLVELLVVMVILGVVLAAIVTTSVGSQRLGVRDRESAQAVRDAQAAAFRMTVELRQAIAIMPTGASAGMCPSTSTASCIDFLVRTRSIDPTTNNHWIRRERIDCTQTYVAANDPNASTYRSCVRYVGTDVADPGTPGPATINAGVLVARVMNWTTGTCSAVDAAFTCPIFNYRKSDLTSATGWSAAAASTNAAGSPAERINVTLQVPSRGEAPTQGAPYALLVQDSAQLRNILR